MSTTIQTWAPVHHVREFKTDDHLRCYDSPPVKGLRDLYLEGTLLGVTKGGKVVFLCTKDTGPKQDSRVGLEVSTPLPGAMAGDYLGRVQVRK